MNDIEMLKQAVKDLKELLSRQEKRIEELESEVSQLVQDKEDQEYRDAHYANDDGWRK